MMDTPHTQNGDHADGFAHDFEAPPNGRKFKIVSDQPDKKYETYFSLERTDDLPKDKWDSGERSYVEFVNGFLGHLGEYIGAKDGVTSLPSVLKARDEFVAELREDAKSFIGNAPIFNCMKETGKRRGRFEQKVEQLRELNSVVLVCREEGSDSDDLHFNAPASPLTEQQQKLLIAIKKLIP